MEAQGRMTYQEARAFLEKIGARGNLLGLESVRILLQELGNPQDRLSFVHIAGTNGKGSVMSFLEQTLIACGYRVGRYLSPAVFCYEEKIRISGQMISKEEVAALCERIRAAICRIEERRDPLPTIFEVETAMSFLYFADHACDLVLLEVGMGGAEDATNIVNTTILQILSSISLDHMEYLGDTLGKIARVKCGIIKPGVPTVSDWQEQEAETVILEACETQRSPLRFVDPSKLAVCSPQGETRKEQEIRTEQVGLWQFSYRAHRDMQIRLAGAYQLRNAALALEAVDVLRTLGWELPEETVKSAFARTVWEGRFEILQRKPWIVIDGAHNPDAARELMRSLETWFPKNRIFSIFGVFSDKEYDTMIDITAPRAAKIFAVQTKDNPRALPAAALAEAVSRVNPNVQAVGDAREALALARKEAREDDVILAYGSLSFLWEIRDAVCS